MVASFPGALKTFSDPVDDETTILAAQMTGAYREVEAVETELGTDPAGPETDVKTRLDNVDPILLTNRNGGSVSKGDVLVQDTASASSAKETTTSGDKKLVVVAMATIADTVSGYFKRTGVVNVTASAAISISDFVKTSATAKRVIGTSTFDDGVFGMALSSAAGDGSTLDILMFGGTFQAGGGGARALFTNLKVLRASASTIDVDADSAALVDSSGDVVERESVNVTIDITASGANGLDTGSEASSTGYFVWLIWNGTTLAGLLSVSATAPTLPSGYTHKVLAGWVHNDGSSNFVDFNQQGKVYVFHSGFSDLTVNLADSTFTCTHTIPNTLRVARVRFKISHPGASGWDVAWHPKTFTDDAQGSVLCYGQQTVTSANEHTHECPINEALTSYHRKDGGGSEVYAIITMGFDWDW